MTTHQPGAFGKYLGAPPDIYERYFVPAIGQPLAEPVIEAARLQPGQSVFDVACGTGIAARLAAEIVGPAGTVAGCDANPNMLDTARTAVPGDLGIEWHEASADNLPFPDASFDTVLCSQGLQFFPDKRAALAEMRRVLAPTGRVAIGVPGPTPSLMVELHDVLAAHVGAEVAAFVHAVFSLHDPTQIRELLDLACFVDAEIRRESRQLRVAPPADFLWQYVMGTPLALAASQLDDAQRSAIEHDIADRWQDFTGGDGMNFEVELTIAAATAPGPYNEAN